MIHKTCPDCKGAKQVRDEHYKLRWCKRCYGAGIVEQDYDGMVATLRAELAGAAVQIDPKMPQTATLVKEGHFDVSLSIVNRRVIYHDHRRIFGASSSALTLEVAAGWCAAWAQDVRAGLRRLADARDHATQYKEDDAQLAVFQALEWMMSMSPEDYGITMMDAHGIIEDLRRADTLEEVMTAFEEGGISDMWEQHFGQVGYHEECARLAVAGELVSAHFKATQAAAGGSPA